MRSFRQSRAKEKPVLKERRQKKKWRIVLMENKEKPPHRLERCGTRGSERKEHRTAVEGGGRKKFNSSTNKRQI